MVCGTIPASPTACRVDACDTPASAHDHPGSHKPIPVTKTHPCRGGLTVSPKDTRERAKVVAPNGYRIRLETPAFLVVALALDAHKTSKKFARPSAAILHHPSCTERTARVCSMPGEEAHHERCACESPENWIVLSSTRDHEQTAVWSSSQSSIGQLGRAVFAIFISVPPHLLSAVGL